MLENQQALEVSQRNLESHHRDRRLRSRIAAGPTLRTRQGLQDDRCGADESPGAGRSSQRSRHLNKKSKKKSQSLTSGGLPATFPRCRAVSALQKLQSLARQHAASQRNESLPRERER